MFESVIMYTIPAIIVFVGVYIVMSKVYKQEILREDYELKKQNTAVVLPLKLRAYERITLFLTRTAPDSLLMRFEFGNMTVVQLQKMLLQSIRDEYEHNLSQQIYVSTEAWTMVVSARESIIQLINMCASKLDSKAPAMELAQAVLATYSASKDTPTEIAINYIKEELKKY